MDSNPAPPLIQPLSPFSDDKDGAFAAKNDAPNGGEGSNGGVRGSIAERRAAKFGFRAERISTPRFRTTSPLNSPAASGARSPCITIPPGISPAALLDSPIMLPNAQPSPTTGTFPLPHLNYGGDTDNISDIFRFKPQTDSFMGFGTLDNQEQGNCSDFRAVDFEFPVDLAKEDKPEKYSSISAAEDENVKNSEIQMAHIENQMSRQIEPVHGENVAPQPLKEERGTFAPIGTGRNSEDGYNWRKYGQKQVKGSEYPRSYYKCTHPNCEVKKKIERSYDGQITEIIYKGTHNHLKPQPNRRTQLGSVSSYDENENIEVGSVWKSLQNGDFKFDGIERTSSASVVTELSDPFSKSMGTFDSARTPEHYSTPMSNDDDDDGATQGSISLGGDTDGEESESKRRKLESSLIETSLTSRAIREPRVVVQIESEIDILDDGYRWRKYGQKVVKGNPNPRSYYKCTSTGCLVRKHVERASHNLKYVITTYEGKHNHEVPAARNSTSNNNLSQVPSNSQPLAISRNTNGPKLEKQIQDYTPSFDRKPTVNNEYLRQVFPGNFSNEMKPSNYPLKFPTFQNTVPYNPFGLNHYTGQQTGSISSLVPDFAFSMPQNLHNSANLSLAGAEFGYNLNPIGQDQSFIVGQQLVRPKQEQRDDAGQTIMDHVDANPSSSSLYHQMMGNFPS